MRPVIGISTRPRPVASSAGERLADTVQHTYRKSVADAGGIPILLAPTDREAIPRLLELVDGVVLTGGGDIDPARYGRQPDDTVYQLDDERDRFELGLASYLATAKIPTLAICRGLQIVNVALGGTLIVDIPSAVGTQHSAAGEEVYVPHQSVELVDGSAVANAIGTTSLLVNSIHHQSVDDLGEDLCVTGHAEDGVVEAIESTVGWPLLAVQWHPEYLTRIGDVHSKALFAELIRLASANLS